MLSTQELRSMCLKTRHVLLIYPDDAIREMLLLCLETIPQCQVNTVNSGIEAMKNLAHIDAIVLDSDESLPGINWRDLVGYLQQNSTTKTIPLILLTATPYSLELLECQRNSNIKAIAKTFNLMNIADRVAQLLNWD